MKKLLLLLLLCTYSALTVAKPAKLELTDQEFQDTIHAVHNGDVRLLRVRLDQGFDANTLSHIGIVGGPVSLLMHASRFDQPEITKLLLARGAKVNWRDPASGDTALYWATSRWKYSRVNKMIMTMLLKAGADPNLCDQHNRCPLHRADHPDVVRLLLKYGADPNAKASNGQGEMLLVHAENPKTLPILLKAGTDPNVHFSQALSVAAASHAASNVWLLLRALPASRTGTRKIAIHRAVLAALRSGELALATQLRQRGDASAWPTLQQVQAARAADGLPDESEIYWHYLQGDRAAAIESYLTIQNYGCGQYSLLTAAVQKERMESLRALLDLGVDINYRRDPPLQFIRMPVAAMSSSGIARVRKVYAKACGDLLDYDAYAGLTALHTAIIKKNFQFAKALVQAGADLSVATKPWPAWPAENWRSDLSPAPSWISVKPLSPFALYLRFESQLEKSERSRWRRLLR
jgi:ankyrin repeat protein